MSSNVSSSSPVKSKGLHVGAIKPGVAKKDPILV
ncbi:MAG: ABC transporter ATP-binding protein, partial [Actinobacteria bacterium]|nr:ABC transporter ATP-binding protein [Actinomycetota bacterium]